MALLAVYCRDPSLKADLERALKPVHALVTAPSWDGFRTLAHERPATLGLVDLEALPGPREARRELAELRRSFPSLGVVLLARPGFDPGLLFAVGRTGVGSLVILGVDGGDANLVRIVAEARAHSATVLVTRVVAPYLPRRELQAVNLALDGVHRQWSAEEYADRIGLSRPFLSERLKACGLPSAGHLLLWARLLHAGHWLTDPGRTAESVSRQLAYSSGAAFRRALKGYTGATPTEVVERGGLSFVLSRFEGECEIDFRRRPFAVA